MNIVAGLNHALARLTRPRRGPTILMYHRVATPAVDPWALAVTPSHFEKQIDALAASGRVISLDRFVRLHRERKLPDSAVAITFDDGYRDNASVAAPILERFGVPATIFLATGAIEASREFWWDELDRLVLLSRRSFAGDVQLPGGVLRLEIDDGVTQEEARTWRSWHRRPRPRFASYLKLWEHLKQLPPVKIEEALAILRDLLSDGTHADIAAVAMNGAEARNMVSSGLIAVAPHTVDHVDLQSIGPVEARRQIRQSIEFCSDLAGRPVEGFSYPYGAHNASVRQILSESGLLWACSTRSARLRPRERDMFDLPRRVPSDADGGMLMAKLA
jgi:peptidoglycan/xylan/chitin deacetylase (PgdA/CDA1 family)